MSNEAEIPQQANKRRRKLIFFIAFVIAITCYALGGWVFLFFMTLGVLSTIGLYHILCTFYKRMTKDNSPLQDIENLE